MPTPPEPGHWASVDVREAVPAMIASAAIGVLRMGYLIKRGRDFRLIDLVVDPAMAVLGGMLAWMLAVQADVPRLGPVIATSLGAWAGPRLIQWLERKYLQSVGLPVTGPADLDPPNDPKARS